MKIPHIHFQADEKRPRGGLLIINSANDLRALFNFRVPQVLVIRNGDANILKGYPEFIFDRGQKDARKGLAFYLIDIQDKRIPMLFCDFTSTGKLENSVRRLLARAAAAMDCKTFIIAVQDDLFNAVRKDYPNKDAPSMPDAASVSTTVVDMPPAEDIRCVVCSPNSDDLAEMMDFTVPEALRDRYLGNSPEIKTVRKMIMAAAASSIPVLILGPSGTGKELVAWAIHQYSKCKGPFVALNCGAISRELLESELFGHKKGAFTGATEDKVGMWCTADGGTLFLDEVGDLLPEHQAKILRALQSKKIRRIGDNIDKTVTTRIIAATNRDLFFMVKQGQFREDLYYRLRGVLIRTPPLKDCPEQIPPMADIFWRGITDDAMASLPEPVKQALKAYPWPGNVRHLKSVLRQLHVLFPGKALEIKHLHYIMAMDDPTQNELQTRTATVDVKPHLGKCLRHLRRVDEAVNASMAMIDPFFRAKRIDQEKLLYVKSELLHHLNEMELLLQNPLLFGDPETFTGVYHLKGKLTFFSSLLAEGYAPAQEYWEKEIKEEFAQVLTKIFNAFETVLDQA